MIVNNPLNSGSLLDGTKNPLQNADLKLNGQERFTTFPGFYFNYFQPETHHSNTPNDGVNIYSFSLKPELFQPSGTCNMSRINKAILNLEITDKYNENIINNNNSTIHIYASNFNILRFMEGMAGIAYTNS